MALFGIKTKPKPEPAAADRAAATPGKPAPPKAAKRKTWFTFLTDDPPGEKILSNPEQDERRLWRLVKRVQALGITLIVLTIGFIVAVPLLQPSQIYFVRRIGEPVGSERLLTPLNLPNLTQQAILSWATTTVTEVMTYHFANYNERISSFRGRFTPEGWKQFVLALLDAAMIEKFKKNSLVLTSAPSDQPLIASEGINPETLEYEWRIQVPVILTYITNNNKRSRSNTVVKLTAVRISTLQNPYGIAIKNWQAR